MLTRELKPLEVGQYLNYEELVLVDEIVHYLDLYSKTWDEDLYNRLLKALNNYLELLRPLRYVPQVVEKLAEDVVIPLWEAGVDWDELRKLLESVLIARKHGIEGASGYVSELTGFARELLYKLGLSRPEEVLHLCNNEQYYMECLLSAVVTALILSTNP